MEMSMRKIGALQIGIILLALATAGIHFYLFLGNPSFLLMFLFNALGYLGLLGAYFLPLPFFGTRKRLVRYLFLGYTLFTILAWVVIGERSTIAYIDKAIEVGLVVLLFLDRQ